MHARGRWPKMHQEKSPKLPRMLISPELVEGDFLRIDWFSLQWSRLPDVGHQQNEII